VTASLLFAPHELPPSRSWFASMSWIAWQIEWRRAWRRNSGPINRPQRYSLRVIDARSNAAVHAGRRRTKELRPVTARNVSWPSVSDRDP
jgi:hypothetical protein